MRRRSNSAQVGSTIPQKSPRQRSLRFIEFNDAGCLLISEVRILLKEREGKKMPIDTP